MKLSVVMPVYNECATLREVVGRVLAVPVDLELLCVDDGSKDGSRELLDELQTIHYRHVDVAQNQIHRVVAQHSQSLGSVAGFEHLGQRHPCLSQGTFHNFSHNGRIVHNQRAYVSHDLPFANCLPRIAFHDPPGMLACAGSGCTTSQPEVLATRGLIGGLPVRL